MTPNHILEAVENILKGSLVFEQIDTLLEMSGPPPTKSQGWWPPKNSRHGEPLSATFWGEIMRQVMHLKDKGMPANQILRKVARQWETTKRAVGAPQVTVELIKEFMKATGIYGAFTSCTLDMDTVLDIFASASRGSGIWTTGTKDTMLHTPYSGRIPKTDPSK